MKIESKPTRRCFLFWLNDDIWADCRFCHHKGPLDTFDALGAHDDCVFCPKCLEQIRLESTVEYV